MAGEPAGVKAGDLARAPAGVKAKAEVPDRVAADSLNSIAQPINQSTNSREVILCQDMTEQAPWEPVL